MSTRLVDLGDDEHLFEASEWSWGPAARLLVHAAILDLAAQVQLEEAGFAELNPRQARAFAAHLREQVLPELGPLDWIDLHGERQTESSALAFDRLQQSRQHHAGREFLERLAVFCERCAGFLVS